MVVILILLVLPEVRLFFLTHGEMPLGFSLFYMILKNNETIIELHVIVIVAVSENLNKLRKSHDIFQPSSLKLNLVNCKQVSKQSKSSFHTYMIHIPIRKPMIYNSILIYFYRLHGLLMLLLCYNYLIYMFMY